MVLVTMIVVFGFFFFQAEDGIRDAQESRGLGDVYKRQIEDRPTGRSNRGPSPRELKSAARCRRSRFGPVSLSLIHI